MSKSGASRSRSGDQQGLADAAGDSIGRIGGQQERQDWRHPAARGISTASGMVRPQQETQAPIAHEVHDCPLIHPTQSRDALRHGSFLAPQTRERKGENAKHLKELSRRLWWLPPFPPLIEVGRLLTPPPERAGPGPSETFKFAGIRHEDHVFAREAARCRRPGAVHCPRQEVRGSGRGGRRCLPGTSPARRRGSQVRIGQKPGTRPPGAVRQCHAQDHPDRTGRSREAAAARPRKRRRQRRRGACGREGRRGGDCRRSGAAGDARRRRKPPPSWRRG